jgi:hypothetical protein
MQEKRRADPSSALGSDTQPIAAASTPPKREAVGTATATADGRGRRCEARARSVDTISLSPGRVRQQPPITVRQMQ